MMISYSILGNSYFWGSIQKRIWSYWWRVHTSYSYLDTVLRIQIIGVSWIVYRLQMLFPSLILFSIIYLPLFISTVVFAFELIPIDHPWSFNIIFCGVLMKSTIVIDTHGNMLVLLVYRGVTLRLYVFFRGFASLVVGIIFISRHLRRHIYVRWLRALCLIYLTAFPSNAHIWTLLQCPVNMWKLKTIRIWGCLLFLILLIYITVH